MNKKYTKVIIAIILSAQFAGLVTCIGLISEHNDVLEEIDESISLRIRALEFDDDIESYLDDVELLVNRRDCLILLSSSGEIIGSRGITAGIVNQQIVHDKIQFTDNKIIVNESDFDIVGYVTDLNINMKDVNYHFLSDNNTKLIHIPRWKVDQSFVIISILQSVSRSFLVSALIIFLFSKVLTALRNEQIGIVMEKSDSDDE